MTTKSKTALAQLTTKHGVDDHNSALEARHAAIRYQRALRLAVAIMCQEAAGNYLLRLRAESQAAAKEIGHDR